ncbi:MAG: histidine phosphatase family protein [Bacteroidota bacterium]|nr:histidine phosphatase family protein [Bacteroidota bacterium]
MKNIYLIRHGQTDYNLRGIVQGSRVDTSLNETGQKQAQMFFEAYKHVPFDKIYTSKLKRTVESVAGFIANGIPYESFEGLNEISWGDNDGKVSNTEMHDYYTHVSNEWANGNLDLQIGGGESPNEVSARQKPVLDIILSQKNEKNILICMHGRAIRILLCLMLGQSLTEMDSFGHSNLCLYLLRYENGKIHVIKSNDTKHLEQ